MLWNFALLIQKFWIYHLGYFYAISDSGPRDGGASSESWGGYFAWGEPYSFFFAANNFQLKMLLGINVNYFLFVYLPV
jgi:hypothetical protein